MSIVIDNEKETKVGRLLIEHILKTKKRHSWALKQTKWGVLIALCICIVLDT